MLEKDSFLAIFLTWFYLAACLRITLHAKMHELYTFYTAQSFYAVLEQNSQHWNRKKKKSQPAFGITINLTPKNIYYTFYILVLFTAMLYAYFTDYGSVQQKEIYGHFILQLPSVVLLRSILLVKTVALCSCWLFISRNTFLVPHWS